MKQQNEISQKQLNLEKESSTSEITNLENKLDRLQNEVNEKLKEKSAKSGAHVTRKPNNTYNPKGKDRNKKCPCGSGKKVKHCHPDGF